MDGRRIVARTEWNTNQVNNYVSNLWFRVTLNKLWSNLRLSDRANLVLTCNESAEANLRKPLDKHKRSIDLSIWADRSQCNYGNEVFLSAILVTRAAFAKWLMDGTCFIAALPLFTIIYWLWFDHNPPIYYHFHVSRSIERSLIQKIKEMQ